MTQKKQLRGEQDSLGEVHVPATALYQAQTQRAVDNFQISGRPMPAAFLRALASIKRCAADVNMKLNLLDRPRAKAIAAAAAEVATGRHLEHFPVDVFQTGSGTSTNMNMNEVIATLVTQKCGRNVSANDHVNMGQSSNDVIPTAIHVSAVLEIRATLLPALARLHKTVAQKAQKFDKHIKTGRTHLMDAVPLSLGQELGGWALQIAKGIERVGDTEKRLLMLSQGGTAVGTGLNAAPAFSGLFCRRLRKVCGAPFVVNASFF